VERLDEKDLHFQSGGNLERSLPPKKLRDTLRQL
jgi:hypothetical protein